LQQNLYRFVMVPYVSTASVIARTSQGGVLNFYLSVEHPGHTAEICDVSLMFKRFPVYITICRSGCYFFLVKIIKYGVEYIPTLNKYYNFALYCKGGMFYVEF